MTAALVAFVATIRPAPQGSHTPIVSQPGGGRGRAVVDPGTGQVLTYGGKGKPKVFMKDSSPGLAAYRKALAFTARAAAARAGLRSPLAEPVATVLTFEFPRPKNGRAWPDSRATGDVDKLERAVHDALTEARVVDDDCRIVGGLKLCRFTDDLSSPGKTHVSVYRVAEFLELVALTHLTVSDI